MSRKIFQFCKIKLSELGDPKTCKRGGGIKEIHLGNKTKIKKLFSKFCFDTIDAMGANFINSCLEEFAKFL